MAVLLRSIGIPSRVITGFRGGQFNQLNSTYIIRARDAHSWVEAYMPGAGWTTFDPTPAGIAPVESPWTRLQLYLDAAREFWREWIVNYDAVHQQALSVSTVHHTRRTFLDLRAWSSRQYRKMLNAARRVHRTATQEPERILRPTASLLIVAVLCLLPFAALRIRNYLRSASPSRSPASASAILFLRMTRRLARRGYPRSPSQTASELGAAIAEPQLREAVTQFGIAYERARFGGSAMDAEALPSLYQRVCDVLKVQ